MPQSGAPAPLTAFFRPSARTLPISGRRIGLGSPCPPGRWHSPTKTGWPAPVTDVSEDPPVKSYPFPVWSGLLARKHHVAMGVAIWTFLWLLDRVTADVEGWGTVLGGRPVKDREIAQNFGVHQNSVRADRKKLLAGKYIEGKRTPYGFVYRIRNSRKFGIWRKRRVTENCDSRVTENCQSEKRDSLKSVTPESQKNVETKKTMQLDHAAKQKPFWDGFQVFWETYPRKDAKKAAERAFRRISPTELPAILASVSAKKQTEQWLKEDGLFIPYASTFLNQERWKDPLPGRAEQRLSIPVRIPTLKEIRVEH